MRSGIRFIISLFFFLTSPLFAGNQSAIQSFNSQIMINQDASVDVSEIIQLSATEKNEAKQLVRQLTLSNPRNYEIRSITLDGVPVSYQVHIATNQLTINMNEVDQPLPKGIFTYIINYHVKDAVHFGTSADELHWEITNNGFNLPILTTLATITLPDAAHILNYSAYLNNKKNTGEITIDQAEAGVFSISTRQPLQPHQSLSLSISWPKGIVRVKNYSQTLKMDLTENRVNEWELGITLAVLIYYLFFWFRIGRNLNDTHHLPLFQPPAGISAAAARFLTQMRFDDKTFVVGILSLATKNYLRLSIEKHVITLHLNKEATAKLENEEEALKEALFKNADVITLTRANCAQLQLAKEALRSSLKNAYEQLYFKSNRGYIRLGMLLSSAAFFAPLFSSIRWFHTLMAISGLCLFTYVLYRLGHRFLKTAALANHVMTFKNMSIAAVEFSILAITALFAAYTLNLFSNNIPPITLILLGFLLIINLIFYHLMRSPTDAGRDILNQLEGFRLFFHTTEKLRFAALAPPEMTPALIDRYIPYAIALGEENAWGERAAATQSSGPATPYQSFWLQLHEKHPAPTRQFAFHMKALLIHTLHRAGL